MVSPDEDWVHPKDDGEQIGINTQYTISANVNNTNYGSVSPVGSIKVAPNSSQTFTFSPKSGYQLDYVHVDGYVVTLTGNSFTLSNVSKNRTIYGNYSTLNPLLDLGVRKLTHIDSAKYAVFYFYAEEGATYEITMPFGDFDSQMFIFDQNENVIANNDDYNGTTSLSGVQVNGVGGYLYVYVEGYDTYEYGDFSIVCRKI